MKKTLKILLCAVGFVLIMFLLNRTLFCHPSELTVSARFRIPANQDDLSYAYDVSQNHGYKEVRLIPADEIRMSSGEHGAPFRSAKIKNGVFCTDIAYDAETDLASATLYVFYPGYSKPAIDVWEGKPGETVGVLLEI